MFFIFTLTACNCLLKPKMPGKLQISWFSHCSLKTMLALVATAIEIGPNKNMQSFFTFILFDLTYGISPLTNIITEYQYNKKVFTQKYIKEIQRT